MKDADVLAYVMRGAEVLEGLSEEERERVLRTGWQEAFDLAQEAGCGADRAAEAAEELINAFRAALALNASASLTVH